MDQYLINLRSISIEYAYRQLATDIRLNWRGLAYSGRDKAIAALIGFASRD